MHVVRIAGLASIAFAVAFGACSTFEEAPSPPVTDGGIDTGTVAPADAGPAADAASKYRAAVLADKPLAYWRMGAAEGAVIHDEMGGPDIALGGAAPPTLGVAGAIRNDPDPAVGFDGTSGFGRVDRQLSRAFDFGNLEPFSIEVWVKPTAIRDGGFQSIFGNKNGAPPEYGYIFYLDFERLTPAVSFRYAGRDAGSTSLETPVPPPNVFTYYAITFNGVTLSLYVNGGVSQMTGGLTAMTARTQELAIARESEVDTNNFGGALDEFAIYAHALTDAEVSRHYLAATAP